MLIKCIFAIIKLNKLAGIYIHIPFCKQKCYYCDFHFSVSLRQKDAMLEAIKNELKIRSDELSQPIETIYLGGGTPTLFSASELHSIFDTIYSNYEIIANPEISLEANPDDLSRSYLKDLRNLPINRLSIGVQSFYDSDLKFMNRAHTSNEALQSIKNAQDIGYENITIDLIYGIPNLSTHRWHKNIETFLALELPHLSSYALTVEPNTALDYFIKTKKYPPLDEALARKHFDILVQRMKSNDFIHYELSNFGKENYFSKHNTSYWQGKSYLGIGPSAHSFKQDARSWNVANNAQYIKSLASNKLPATTENLSLSEQYNEYIMTGLRTIWGVDINVIQIKFGQKFAIYFRQSIQPHIAYNNLQIKNEKVQVLPSAFFLIDGIIADLFWVD